MGDRTARIVLAAVCCALSALLPAASAQAAGSGAVWHLAAVGAPEAWSASIGAGVTVAVVDSGVDAGHPALAGSVLPGRSYVEPVRSAPVSPAGSGAEAVAHADPVGHGTAVAGLIAGGAPATGVAPGARILPVRVLDEENRYRDSAMVAEAVRWAVDRGADIINLSLGGHHGSEAFAAAIDYAWRHDVLVVACTGNQGEAGGDEAVWFPARDDRVLAVTGVDRTGSRWPTAITGGETELAAPSAELTAAAAGGGYKRVTGTSFAAAIVSGAAALVRSAHPDLSADHVRRLLAATAKQRGPDLGAGVVDAAAAMRADLDRLPPFALRAQPAPDPSLPVAASAAALLGASALLLRARSRPRGPSAPGSPARTMAG